MQTWDIWTANFRMLLRYGLLVVSFLYLSLFIYFITRETSDKYLYIPIYGLIYGQLPAILILSAIYTWRRSTQRPAWSYLKTEVVLLISTFVLLVALMVPIFMTGF